MQTTHFPVGDFSHRDTPFYYYDLTLLGETLKAASEAAANPDYKIHYAVKANSNPVILRQIAEAGFGADTVSIGEVRAAVEAGFDPKKIVLAGVGKTDAEIEEALRLGIGCLNVESAEEFEVVSVIAAGLGVKAPVALRVNPEIDAHTHHYITTGLAENKFGISMGQLGSALEKAVSDPHIDFRGLHAHIGSQVTDFTPYKVLCERLMALEEKYPGIPFPTLNVGGGLGIDYDAPDAHPVPDFKAFFKVFHDTMKLRPGQELHFELGRAIVAQCGSVISRVVFVKEGVGKKFVILDAGMTTLIRPALYQAHHKIENLSHPDGPEEVYDVVGPVCESSDTFGVEERLPLTRRGDLMALRSAGAYGEVMASGYNCRPLPPAVYGR